MTPGVKMQGTNKGRDNMKNMVIIMVIVVCAGWVVWRRYRRHAPTAVVPPEAIPRENFALKAFAHGNTCLAEGKFAEATAAFHQARELEPKHPHVAARLAEVERRQQAASA
jgi:predicted negative regulator of RcsB-dependent stress response